MMNSWSIKLPGEPHLRILLRHIAFKNGCTIGTREFAASSNVVQGSRNNVAKVRDQFHAIRTALYLRQAMVVAQFPQYHSRTVENLFTVAFVNRACELLVPQIKRGFTPYHVIEQRAFDFAEHLLQDGEIVVGRNDGS